MKLVPSKTSGLTRAQFEQLAELPPEQEWLANLTSAKTRRAYRNDVREFIAYTRIGGYTGLRSIARSHVIAWRKDLEKRELSPASIRRKLSSLRRASGNLLEVDVDQFGQRALFYDGIPRVVDEVVSDTQV